MKVHFFICVKMAITFPGFETKLYLPAQAIEGADLFGGQPFWGTLVTDKFKDA
jgi:hypothetical protein